MNKSCNSVPFTLPQCHLNTHEYFVIFCNSVPFNLPQCHLNTHEYFGKGGLKYVPSYSRPQGKELILTPSLLMRPTAFLHSLNFCVAHDSHEVNWQGWLE